MDRVLNEFTQDATPRDYLVLFAAPCAVCHPGRRLAGTRIVCFVDTYTRMLAEHRRIKASRDRGFHRKAYLLSMEELEQIAAARTHPSRRG